MLFRFRCNSTFVQRDHIEAHFDIPGSGMRPLALVLPKPGPAIGELYDVEITGPGLSAAAHAAQPIGNEQQIAAAIEAEVTKVRDLAVAEIAKAQKVAAEALAERDAALGEIARLQVATALPSSQAQAVANRIEANVGDAGDEQAGPNDTDQPSQ